MVVIEGRLKSLEPKFRIKGLGWLTSSEAAVEVIEPDEELTRDEEVPVLMSDNLDPAGASRPAHRPAPVPAGREEEVDEVVPVPFEPVAVAAGYEVD